MNSTGCPGASPGLFRTPAVLLFLLASTPAALIGAVGNGALFPRGSEAPRPDSAETAIPTAVASFTELSVDVDGVLDDEAWSQAVPVSGFVQREPVQGIPAEMDTEVRVLMTSSAIYIGARMWDDAPDRIADQLVRRDEEGQFDYFEVGLDPNLDRRTGYVFRISAAGVQADRYIFDDTEQDRNWNAVWASGVRRDDQGWTAEIRIPLSQIRYDRSQDSQTWGINFSRRRLASNEVSDFALVSRLRRGIMSQFGLLEGVEAAEPSRRMEVIPYVLSSLAQGPAEAGDPFFDGSAADAQAGVDLRWGLSTNFTLDASVNPDFGQVEADPAVINLTAFEVRLEERRPFFVEDARVFDFRLSGRQNQLYYSRRIGRSPHGSGPSGADFEEVPATARIMGAAKLTGRTASGLSVGGLFAITGKTRGDAYFEGDDRFQDFLAEPQTEFGVLRVRQDLRQGDSQIGGIVTGMRRALPADGSFDWLPSSAVSVGVDFEHTWNNREWALSGFFANGYVRGDSTALLDIQESSLHLFQRPDDTRNQVDSTATDMSGAEWRLELEKRGGEHWTGAVWVGELTPTFEINDLGFSTNTEKLDAGARIGYREIRPGSVFRNYSLSFWSFHNWSHEALDDTWSWNSWKQAHKSGSFTLRGEGQFLNWWEAEGSVRYSPRRYDYTGTRGGPVMANPAETNLSLRVNTDRRKPFSVGPRVEYSWDTGASGRRVQASMDFIWRPTSSLEIRLDPRYENSRAAAQYVTAADTLFFEPTYGDRYLFAELDRESFSLDTRVNLAFSPTLTLEMYAQALLSAGDYLTYAQLDAARTFDFRRFAPGTYGEDGAGVTCTGGDICLDADGTQHVDFDGDGRADFDFRDRDFNFRSLRGNLVLRWEYRPGSTLYLVWQHQRSDRQNFGDFDFGRDLSALGSLEGDNLFMIKVRYWLGL